MFNGVNCKRGFFEIIRTTFLQTISSSFFQSLCNTWNLQSFAKICFTTESMALKSFRFSQEAATGTNERPLFSITVDIGLRKCPRNSKPLNIDRCLSGQLPLFFCLRFGKYNTLSIVASLHDIAKIDHCLLERVMCSYL